MKLIPILSAFVALSAFAAGNPWPPTNAESLINKPACAFPKEADIGFYAEPVQNHPGYLFHYRHKGEAARYVLLVKSQSTDRCAGTIVGALELPASAFTERFRPAPHNSRWAVAFECRALGRHWERAEPAIGIVDQELPAGYFSPILAWSVNVDTGTFLATTPRNVVCARFNDSGD